MAPAAPLAPVLLLEASELPALLPGTTSIASTVLFGLELAAVEVPVCADGIAEDEVLPEAPELPDWS